MNNESMNYGLLFGAAAGLILVSGTCLSAGPTGANCPDDVTVEWSLDIGSDSELSDPAMDGDETVDPGDAYWWHGGGLPVGGADGIRDDFFAFGGFDPFPDAPDPALATAAPTCSGFPLSQIFSQYFDMDGHDNLDLNIIQFLPADQGLPPVAQFPSTCIWEAKNLIVSFDDDRALPYTDCDIPVTSASPMGVTYGTTTGQDEIIAVTVTGPIAPASVVNMFGLSDEKSLDISLAPNPDNSEEDDDDVDSLDVYPHDDDSCQYWYFSPDHEATGMTVAGLPLDPGSIYLATGAGPLQIVDDVAHLGLLESTDVDAFEFVWLEATNIPGGPAGGAGLAFAVLFSVDDDDPTTPIDESGGLNPGQIYASYMNGFSFSFLDDPLRDDVDALTNYCLELQPPVTPPCDGDANGDGVIDVNDISYVLFRLGNVAPPSPVDGDVNGDLVVDVNDISYVLFRLGNPC